MKVGLLDIPSGWSGDLSSYRTEILDNQFKLCYVTSQDSTHQDELARLGAYHVDTKVTYNKSLNCQQKYPSGTSENPPVVVRSYFGSCTEELKSLALDAGQYSRFNCDSRFPKDKYVALYHKWIERSVNREIAQEMLVASVDDVIVGFVSLSSVDNNQGSIQLIVVNALYRGRGIGAMLLAKAIEWFQEQEYHGCSVATQERNTAACALYESLGFKRQSAQFVFHWWL